MAKKSNKTEHVMKLITKDKAEVTGTVDLPDIEATISSSAGNELNLKTKLNIEIEPEIELKEASSNNSKSGGRHHVSVNRRYEGRTQADDGSGSDYEGRTQADDGSGSDYEGRSQADDGSGDDYDSRGQADDGPRGDYDSRARADDGSGSDYDSRAQTDYGSGDDYDSRAQADGGSGSDYEGSDQNQGYERGQTVLELIKEFAADIPDGTPFENMGDTLRPDIFGQAGTFAGKQETLEDVRASIRRDEEKRMKKIEFEGQLFGYNNNIINLTELLTKELMPSIMEKMGVCNCPTCAGNVMALALNTLPPRYVTTDVGKQYSQLEIFKSQSELDVVQAVTKACLRVKSMPRHDGDEAAKP
ncbi:hypothetical protein FACS1894127_6610 [Clostridia bacterium]|nr:hypothetical protein FACS1894127_6610 [Clostridia bacterium]